MVRGEKEFLLSFETMEGKTLEGNPRYLAKQFGKFSFPFFVKAYNAATGQSEANGKIDRTEERYEVESSPAAIKKLFAKDQVGTNTAMTLDYGEGQQFVVNNKKDFIEMEADKLISKITGRSVESITGGGPSQFVISSDDAASKDRAQRGGNTQQEQEEARRRMYDVALIAGNSSSTFGPTEEQRAAAEATLMPQPTLNVVPSILPPSFTEQQQQEQVKIEQKEGDKPGEPKRASGQSRATNRIGEDIGVVLKNEDTGVKQNIRKDSMTIEEPQGQAAAAAKKQRDQDEEQEEKEEKRRR